MLLYSAPEVVFTWLRHSNLVVYDDDDDDDDSHLTIS